MQRKPGFPVANCSIKMPDNAPPEALEEEEPQQRRQQLINFGHAQWGFNNWSWAVSKQDLDFVDLTCGKYTAGVAAFVSITIKTLDIHRENVGYATALAPTKGSAIHRARKCAVTNALRETLLSFGGVVATELMELDAHRAEAASDLLQDPQNLASKPTPSPMSEPKNAPVKNTRKEETSGSGGIRAPVIPPAVKNAASVAPPIAKALPMPANLPPAANRPLPPAAPRAPPAASVAAPPPAPPHAAPTHAAPPHAPPLHAPHAPPPHAAHARPNSNAERAAGAGAAGGAEGAEARAERKRRQRLAQEEFRLKQLQRINEEKQGIENISTNVDNLLMAIPTQEIIKQETGNIEEEAGKRKSPSLDGGAPKRRGNVLSRLDGV